MRLKRPPLPAIPARRVGGSARAPWAPKKGDHHRARVLLQLVRHSTYCSPMLRDAFEVWEVWDYRLDRLPPFERQVIYGRTVPEIMPDIIAEFDARTDTIRDHHPHTTTCELCGKRGIRWEFEIYNLNNSQSIRCGSSCIEKYGLSVDGTAPGEAAVRVLRNAISRAKRQQVREAWQAKHPLFIESTSSILVAMLWCMNHDDYDRKRRARRVSYHYEDIRYQAYDTVRKILRFHRKNGYLTDRKTREWKEAIAKAARVLNIHILAEIY